MESTETHYRKVYDPIAAAKYERKIDESGRKHLGETRLVLQAFRHVPKSDTVLDFPCGAGRMTEVLRREGWNVEAADVSPGMLDLARKRFAERGLSVPVHHEDLEGSRFGDRQFDTVFCFRVFHHFPDDALRHRIVGELCRIAARRVVLSYLDAWSWTSIRRAVQEHVFGKPNPKYAHTAAEIAAYFAPHGFVRLEDRGRLSLLRSLRLAVFERSGGA